MSTICFMWMHKGKVMMPRNVNGIFVPGAHVHTFYVLYSGLGSSQTKPKVSSMDT
jgi:hypothetical protein